MSDALPPDAPPHTAAPSAGLVPRAWHPVRLVVNDDLRRSRLTVFFRLLLAIPHYFWISLIGVVVALSASSSTGSSLLFVARTPKGIHDFLAGYIRYTTQLEAYILLAANPYPAFWPLGEADLPRPRWRSTRPRSRAGGRRSSASSSRSRRSWSAARCSRAACDSAATGSASHSRVAFLLWWVAVFLGRSPRGLRDLVAFCVGYSAQLAAYLFLVTDRYPYSGPNRFVPPRDDEEPHPVRVAVSDDLRRSRVLTFFRLPISIPHIVWFVLWTIPAAVAAVLNWLCALVIGRAPRPFHRFLSRYVRYSTHLWAFMFLIGNPFPGFTGKPGTYPIEVELPPSEPQKRLVTLFRGLLAIPALLVLGGLWGALFTAGFLGWFVALFLGRMPDGLPQSGAYVLRYGAQASAYFYVLTERYPDAGPRPDPHSP